MPMQLSIFDFARARDAKNFREIWKQCSNDTFYFLVFSLFKGVHGTAAFSNSPIDSGVTGRPLKLKPMYFNTLRRFHS